MLFRIIRIAAVLLGAVLLSEGCVQQLDPAPTPEAISFSAGSTLLRDDATKGANPKEADGDVGNFLVFGTKTISDTPYSVFGGIRVNHTSNTWSYSPVRYWDSNAGRYDFLGISGPQSVSGITSTISPISATLTYNVTDTQYDLMAACDSRVSNAGVLDVSSPVQMDFKHLLSAVSVVVYNDSPQQHVALVSYGFRNLYIQQNVKISYHLPNPTIEWLDAGKVKDTSNPLLTWTANGEEGRELDSANTHAPTGTGADNLNWDMMIPQTLNPGSSAPLLMVKYCLVDYSDDPEPVRTVSNPIETPIRLSSIKNSSGNEILEWEAGKKYTYEIHIRYGGGINVTVTTTDWDLISAGTPGLIIS